MMVKGQLLYNEISTDCGDTKRHIPSIDSFFHSDIICSTEFFVPEIKLYVALRWQYVIVDISVYSQNAFSNNLMISLCFPQMDHVPDSNGIAQAANLLAADWGQTNCDTYCTRCRKAFTAALCDAHVELHHPNQVAATIQVSHHEGWVCVAADQEALPPALFLGVQVISFNYTL
jgi:hypothetical protein